ncbi:DNA-3-methyladenine glycosylase I [Paraflavitalea sp. CAU 1676]|uniref:DNA-3-methyladenine glycosylase I n=1 Tax=Paraflavitalea sp. CAU 1676 TaxID=3032598 RepID=UPI0023D996E6|nr:DNA-3-methyladenine glycosylase I [Paraflavitalea sp. CAU 1676]MDF2188795.1 DNA-3-methyladenine glycosylase I [Paraflavitalea sp. CAU 1676]
MAAAPKRSYCEAVWQMEPGNVNIHYHDHEYGFPIHDDDQLFARFVLEINQAGLSWITILRKKENFFKAFDNFNIEKVARYTDKKIAGLLADEGIIRNRLKVNAAIENARRIRTLQKEHGSFQQWLQMHHPKPKEEWVKLFKKTFVFTGGEIVGEFLMSTGYLPGAHIETCPVYKKVLKQKPAWHSKSNK